MKETKIFCNLCRDKIESNAEGKGVHFLPVKGFEFRGISTVENHICNKCIETIVKLERKPYGSN